MGSLFFKKRIASAIFDQLSSLVIRFFDKVSMVHSIPMQYPSKDWFLLILREKAGIPDMKSCDWIHWSPFTIYDIVGTANSWSLVLNDCVISLNVTLSSSSNVLISSSILDRTSNDVLFVGLSGGGGFGISLDGIPQPC